ncbi:MAG TPA: tyrosine-protein phosphatase [Dehalococcoidia bacterium]|nr:tyrosine-protein phosphatase [Dehalococcoidia bacterium]
MQLYSREINFDAIINFRDLGGYHAKGNRTVAWRQLFRSGSLHSMTEHDLTRLKEEIKLTSVINLRSDKGPRTLKEASLLNDAGIRYLGVPFTSYSEEELHHDFSNMGEAYLFRIKHKEYGKRIVDALKIVAEPENHPLLFHCGVGKDRSGVTAAFILSVLGVADEDIITDYTMSAPYMESLLPHLMSDPETPEYIKKLQAYTWEATSESMAWFLSSIRREFGSAREYLQMHGAEISLFNRLEKALLT